MSKLEIGKEYLYRAYSRAPIQLFKVEEINRVSVTVIFADRTRRKVKHNHAICWNPCPITEEFFKVNQNSRLNGVNVRRTITECGNNPFKLKYGDNKRVICLCSICGEEKEINNLDLDDKVRRCEDCPDLVAREKEREALDRAWSIILGEEKEVFTKIDEEVIVKSANLRFCKGCGKGHWRKGKHFCTDECQSQKKAETKKKELDFEYLMKQIRAKKEAQRLKGIESAKRYYANNREKCLDYQVDYRHKKMQDQFLLTVLTTTI